VCGSTYRLTKLDALQSGLLKHCLNEQNIVAGCQSDEVANDASTEVFQILVHSVSAKIKQSN
jgi:hypothetical protein